MRQIPDPDTWPAECQLGCHVEFDALGQSQGPYQRHVRREIPPCEMSLALYRSQASRYRRNAGWTVDDSEEWAQLPWAIEAPAIEPVYSLSLIHI